MATVIASREFASTISIPASACAHAGFRAWATSDCFPQQGRISYINHQVLVDMSPEELENHNQVKAAVTTGLFQLCQDLKLGKLYADGTLLTHAAAGISTEPDATFVSWDAFRSKRIRAVPRPERPGEFLELEGSPDWVLEVLSLSSRKKDTQLLRAAYHAAHIPEYWLIDALGKRIVFKLLEWRKSGYVERAAVRGWHRSPVFGREFRLVRRRDPLDMWQYRLHVRGG